MITEPKKTHILLITENPKLAEHISETFSSAEREYVISEVSSLTKTKQFLINNKPDIVIVELYLSWFSGIWNFGLLFLVGTLSDNLKNMHTSSVGFSKA